MRTTVTFDTLEYMDELKNAGIDIAHAEAITRASSKAFSQIVENQELATKKDIAELKVELIKYISDNNWKLIGTIVALQSITTGLIHFLSK